MKIKYSIILILFPAIVFAGDNSYWYLYKNYNNDTKIKGKIRNPNTQIENDIELVIPDHGSKKITNEKFSNPNSCFLRATQLCNLDLKGMAQGACAPQEIRTIKGATSVLESKSSTAQLLAQYKQNVQKFCTEQFKWSYNQETGQFFDNWIRNSNEGYLSRDDAMKCASAETRYLRQGMVGTPPECTEPKERNDQKVRDAQQSCIDNSAAIFSHYAQKNSNDKDDFSKCINTVKLDHTMLPPSCFCANYLK